MVQAFQDLLSPPTQGDMELASIIVLHFVHVARNFDLIDLASCMLYCTESYGSSLYNMHHIQHYTEYTVYIHACMLYLHV